MRALIASVVTANVIGSLAAPAGADETARPVAERALALCERVDRTPGLDQAERLARYEEGVRMSELAVAADPDDARAHLALFCNLGRQLDAGGLSWRAFGRIRRARAAIDRAHALAPDDADVLVAKGEMLRRLPRMLGGDPAEGLALLRRAVEIAPGHAAARLHLAHATAGAAAHAAPPRLTARGD
jgi:tetratricopeptide (TPR) repeat protein